MESEFPQVKLGSICKLRSGYSFKSSEWVEVGEPVIKIANVKSGRINRHGCAFVSPTSAAKAKEWYTQPGDILIAMTGYVGELAWVQEGESYLINQRVGRFDNIDGTRVHKQFLFYALQHQEIRSLLETIARGSAQPNLSAGDAHGIEIPLPPIAEQRVIAESLSALDDKISILRKTNTTLEAIAQAFFKSWFVDFDPVRAKAEGCDPEGVPPEVADLFPREFEESELGEIPLGWRAQRLDQASEINPTRRIGKGAESPYLEMSAVPTKGHRPESSVIRSFSSGTKFVNGDTLLARITPCLENGKSAFVDFLAEGEVGWGSTEFIVLRPRNPLPDYWGYLLCRHEPFRQFAIQAMVGTSGRQRVEVSRLAQYPVAIPTPGIAAAFGHLVEPLRVKIASNDDELKTLAGLRDTLLPRLMSGKLRIPDAQETTA